MLAQVLLEMVQVSWQCLPCIGVVRARVIKRTSGDSAVRRSLLYIESVLAKVSKISD